MRGRTRWRGLAGVGGKAEGGCYTRRMGHNRYITVISSVELRVVFAVLQACVHYCSISQLVHGTKHTHTNTHAASYHICTLCGQTCALVKYWSHIIARQYVRKVCSACPFICVCNSFSMAAWFLPCGLWEWRKGEVGRGEERHFVMTIRMQCQYNIELV